MINNIERTYRELVTQGREVLKLYSGNPTEFGFRFPPKILERVYREYFRTQDYHPHPKGLLTARQSIRDYYGRQGVEVDPENILLTSGTSESFFYLFSLLTKPGDNILTPNPAYPLFAHIADMAGIELRHYSLLEDRNWSVDIDGIHSRTDDRTKAVILVSPNNPTGSVISEGQIREIVEWTNQKKIALICDEVFSEFYFGEGAFPRPIAITKPRLCFTLNGISKMFALPALKLSWIVVTGEKSLVDPAVDRLETTADTFLSGHIPIQEALPHLFREGWEFVQSYKNEVWRRRDLAGDLLKENPLIQFNPPMGSFYLMAKVTNEPRISEEDFVIRLMKEKGVFVHPGYFYDYEKGIHLVISFLMEGEKLKKVLTKVADFGVNCL